jgi:V8-like Glu-specific endopeptidase
LQISELQTHPLLLGICKILMRFQNKDPKILLDGVRVVVQRGTVVTAAHNICRKETRFHAVDVLVCIGYEGARCAPENRMGYQRSESAGIHWGHYVAGNEKYEIAVPHLQAPFEDSRPIIWGKAPTKGKETKIKVVGYPNDVPKHGEGQTMHVSECPIAVHDLQVDEYRVKYYLHTCRG